MKNKKKSFECVVVLASQAHLQPSLFTLQCPSSSMSAYIDRVI